MKPHLSEPTSDAISHSLKLIERIKALIQKKGPLSFSEYMQQVLYAPNLGYYVAGSHKIGTEGDFITAPEISPAFAACLANQCQQILSSLSYPVITELGAGLGTLAIDLLLELEKLNSLPYEYRILEISPDLKQRQLLQFEQRCPHLLNKVKWLDSLAQHDFEGIILGNEVIDALPVSRFTIKKGQTMEMGVNFDGQRFQWVEMGACPALIEAVEKIQLSLGPLPEGFCSEVNLYLETWLQSVSLPLQKGVMIWIDYGHSRSQYYQAARSSGTLSCYYRHHVHHDPFLYPGLQDITAHVDFSLLAESALKLGFELNGYINQAMFLINCGLETSFNQMDISEKARIKKLLSPQLMGEQFKVMALSRNMDIKLLGFFRMQESYKL
jgi:SAM-dependent MidA family methyltransferase